MRLEGRSAAQLRDWCQANGISCLEEHELHCTILYSSAPVPQFTVLNEARLRIPAKVIGWKKLGTALTLELHAPKAARLHRYMIQKGGTHDYPSFIPHTSVCYEWNEDSVPDVCPTNMMLEFTHLVVEAINPNYKDDLSES